MIVACSSHLLVDLPLFGGPVLVVAAAVLWAMRRGAEVADDGEHRDLIEVG